MRLLPFVLALAACAPETTDTAAATGAGVAAGAPTGGTQTEPLSHEADIQRIWDKHCGLACHLNDDDGGLSLSPAYDNIVGVASSDVPTMNLIEPGSLEDSYLWHKLEGTHASVGGDGFPMPRGADLGNAKRAKIQQWIEEGALP